MNHSPPGPDVDLVMMQPDCTIRGIAAAHEALRTAQPRAATIRIDCGSVIQADVTFVQLIASAKATLAARNVCLVVEPAAACVRAAFDRSGVPLPGASQSPSF